MWKCRQIHCSDGWDRTAQANGKELSLKFMDAKLWEIAKPHVLKWTFLTIYKIWILLRSIQVVIFPSPQDNKSSP